MHFGVNSPLATSEPVRVSSCSMAPKNSNSKSDSKPGPYAIVEASGKQFWLQPNRYYDLDRIKANVDETFTISNVLLVNDGKKTTLGTPYVKGANVELKVMAHRRGPKIIVYKKTGHFGIVNRRVAYPPPFNQLKLPVAPGRACAQPLPPPARDPALSSC